MSLNVLINGKNLDVTDAIKAYAEKQAEQDLAKFVENIQEIKITIEKTNDSSHPYKATGIILTRLDFEVIVHEKGEDMYHVLNVLFNKLERAYRKNKEKVFD